MKNKKLVFTFTFIGLLFLLTIWQNSSAAQNTIPYYGWCCSGTAAMAQVQALAYNSAQGRCFIGSWTSPSRTINIIGWTWWQCETRDNNGNIINYYPRPPRATPPASSVSDSTYANYCRYNTSPPTCGYRVVAHGVHDFNHTGAVENWKPYNLTIGP